MSLMDLTSNYIANESETFSTPSAEIYRILSGSLFLLQLFNCDIKSFSFRLMRMTVKNSVLFSTECTIFHVFTSFMDCSYILLWKITKL